MRRAAWFLIWFFVLIAIFGIGYVSGARQVAGAFISLCDAGEKFYDLGPVDQPYRCNRVIDAPPLES